jgi:hypothetical protein
MRSTNMILISSLAFLSLSSGCGKKDTDRVSEAQDCLDKSTSDTALTCLSKVEGVESGQASLVRCSAYFIDQDFASGTRFAQVADQITNGGSGTPDSRTLSALSVMAFVSTKYTMAVNFDLSKAASAECSKSSSAGLIYLSSMMSMSTALLNDLGFVPGSGTPSLTGACAGGVSTATPATKNIMGAAAIAAYNSNCLGKDLTNNVVCQQYQEALGGSADPATVGAALATNLCN